MPTFWLVVALFALSAAGFFLGRQRALQAAGGDARQLHSLPSYYGLNVALTSLVPALGVLVIWLFAQPLIIESTVSGMIPDDLIPEATTRGLVMSDVRRVAEGLDTAIAQGAIGIERRTDDHRAADMLAAIHDGPTSQRLAAERAFLAELDGSCETPIAGLAELDGTTLRLRGEVLRPDGSEAIGDDMTVPVEDGAEAGRQMARKLLAQAGDDFFDWRSA